MPVLVVEASAAASAGRLADLVASGKPSSVIGDIN